MIHIHRKCQNCMWLEKFQLMEFLQSLWLEYYLSSKLQSINFSLADQGPDLSLPYLKLLREFAKQ